ncbi:hypothetical protein [Cupriavidus sp. U2]|uniref:hypothetical protein n=1 Tax=Cupriavidus sp. U2 TaxID=2920269 RepID=UPI00129E1644|nr:hypothetical protein [Cupriavidus sp. U2]
MTVALVNATQEVAELLARAAEFDTSGGGFILEDALAGQVYAVRDECGALLFAWTQETYRDRRGLVAYVTAAAGRDLASMLPHIERVARDLGAGHLGFKTARPGLVRAMQRAGFESRAVEMEKAL